MSISSITASRTCSESGFTSDLVPENTKDETSEHRSTVLVKSRTDTRRAAGMLGEQGLHAVPHRTEESMPPLLPTKSNVCVKRLTPAKAGFLGSVEVGGFQRVQL